jgi:excisionase family DNA binding protein
MPSPALAVLTQEQLSALLEQAAERGAARALAQAGGAAESLLSTEGAAELAGVAPKTIAAWIRAGRLKAGRPGRKWVIARADLLACARSTSGAVDPVREAGRIAASLRR